MSAAAADGAPRGPGRVEFVALVAALFSTVAFSIDAMLPALPRIAAELSPADPDRAQLVVTSFVLGLGLGTLFGGPVSDSIGRRPTLLAGCALYAIGALAAALAPDLRWLLAARVLQGLGVAGPRVVTLAVVRDLYQGREMARIMSLAMMIFVIVPAAAPLIGALITAAVGWRGLFAAFVLFVFTVAGWFALRQPETLPPARRRPFRPAAIAAALGEVLRCRPAMRATAAQLLGYGVLFGFISSAQPITDRAFGQGALFPLWFALVALASAAASLANSRLVGRLGMERLARRALGTSAAGSALYALALLAGLDGPAAFAGWLVWGAVVFAGMGFSLGNLNALALESLGHVAGTASSVVTAVATTGAVPLAALAGLSFDGSPTPVVLALAAMAALGAALVPRLPPAPAD